MKQQDRAALIALLRNCVRGLRETGHLIDEEGELTNQLEEAMDMLEADAVPQEPVGYLAMDGYFIANQRYVMEFGEVPRAKPLFLAAAPQPQRPRLTDDEIAHMWAYNPGWSAVDFARAIEKKVRGEA